MNNYAWWACIAFAVAWSFIGEWGAASAFIAGSFVITALDK